MQNFILAISTICSSAALVMSCLIYYKLCQNKLSVPDTQKAPEATPAMAKELTEEESKEKWTNLKEAFNLSGRNNGRSRTS